VKLVYRRNWQILLAQSQSESTFKAKSIDETRDQNFIRSLTPATKIFHPPLSAVQRSSVAANTQNKSAKLVAHLAAQPTHNI